MKTFTLDFVELERYIAAKCGLDNFSFIKLQNETQQGYNVGRYKPNSFQIEMFEKALREKAIDIFYVGNMLEGLLARGLIEPGHYIVDVCW